MKTEPGDSLRLNKGRKYERALSRLIAERLRPGSVFLDVGAHVGLHSVQAAAVIGQKGTLIAVEPEPSLFNILIQNLFETGVPFLPIRGAAANFNGRTRLYLSETNSGDHHIYPTSEKRRAVEVLAFRLDDLLRYSHLKPDVIKVDVQGSELGVLAGAEELVTKANALAIEFWPRGLEDNGTNPARFLDYLRRFGFKIFDSLGKEKGPAEDLLLLETYRPQKRNFTNLWCLR